MRTMEPPRSQVSVRPPHVAPPAHAARPDVIDVQNLDFHYGPKKALDGITMGIRPNMVTAFIGPSGCGKSTFLRTLNRMNDIIPGARVEGQVRIGGRDIYESFRAYQRSLLKEYTSMADEYSFRVLDARRKVEVIQEELRRTTTSPSGAKKTAV